MSHHKHFSVFTTLYFQSSLLFGSQNIICNIFVDFTRSDLLYMVTRRVEICPVHGHTILAAGLAAREQLSFAQCASPLAYSHHFSSHPFSPAYRTLAHAPSETPSRMHLHAHALRMYTPTIECSFISISAGLGIPSCFEDRHWCLGRPCSLRTTTTMLNGAIELPTARRFPLP